MRAPLIVVVLAVLGAAGYYIYDQSRSAGAANQSESAAAPAQALVSEPDSAALAVFTDVCIQGRASFSDSEDRAAAAGWVRSPDNVNANIARIMAMSRSAELPQATDVVMGAYAHPESPLFIVLTGMNLAGQPVNGCYVYDFGATSLPSLGSLGASLGEPSEQMDEPGVAVSRKWVRPAAFPNVATLRVGHFPSGSPAEEQLGFSGLLLAVTSMSQQ